MYYTVSDTSFKVNVVGIANGNVLESVIGMISCNYLKNTTWTKLSDIRFEAYNVTNGNVFTWDIVK